MLNRIRNFFSIGFKELKKKKRDLVILVIASIFIVFGIGLFFIEFSYETLIGIIVLLLTILMTIGFAYQKTIKAEEETAREKWKERIGRIDYPGNWLILALFQIGLIVLVHINQKGFWNGIITLNPIPISTKFRYLLWVIVYLSGIILSFLRSDLTPRLSYLLTKEGDKPPSKHTGLWFLFLLNIVVGVSFGLVAYASPDLVSDTIGGSREDSIDDYINPTPTITTSPEPEPCLFAAEKKDGFGWQVSFFPGGGIEPKANRDPDKPGCFDITDQGFRAIFDQDSGTSKLQLSCGNSDNPCYRTDILRGIYSQIELGEYSFGISITGLGIHGNDEDTGIYNDADLLIGIGDPFHGGGQFIILRMLGREGQVLVCGGETIYTHCGENPIDAIPLEEFGQREINIKISDSSGDDDLRLFFGGQEVAAMTILDEEDQKLWIGYNFRSTGWIKAEIEFPVQLGELLVSH